MLQYTNSRPLRIIVRGQDVERLRRLADLKGRTKAGTVSVALALLEKQETK